MNNMKYILNNNTVWNIYVDWNSNNNFKNVSELNLSYKGSVSFTNIFHSVIYF